MAAQNTLGKVADVVVDAAKVALDTATGYVVEPVGKALGLVADAPEGSPTPAADRLQPKAVRKAARKAVVERAAGAKTAAKPARRFRSR